MKPAGKRALVPERRFPEFRDAGEWEVKPIGKIATLRNGFAFKSSTYSDNGRYKIITIGNVQAGALFAEDAKTISELPSDIQLHQQLQVGDILISMTGNVGRICRVDIEDCLLNQRVGKFEIHGADIEFFYHILNKDSFRDAMQSRAAGGAQGNLSSSAIEEFTLSIPKQDAEQQKIADCLSSLDELISLEAQRLDALKAHKKGMMQRLFPGEGETVPRLRFPEFRDAGEWEEKSVGDLGEIVTGNTPSTARPEFYGGDIPFVSPADISDHRYVDGTKTTLTALGFDETRPIKANSVLFVCIGSTIGKVTQNVRECATNQQINSIIPNAEHSDGFVYYSLSLNANRIGNHAGMQAVPIINKTLFSSVDLLVPKIEEQQRIADCLSSLDELITAQSERLATLKTHKKGLMQQLFPVLNEIEQQGL